VESGKRGRGEGREEKGSFTHGIETHPLNETPLYLSNIDGRVDAVTAILYDIRS
jgi:hypothetical protein